MMNYRMTLAYDGTDYCGWQTQLNQRTIQSVLNEVLEKLEGGPVILQGAGRTDAGVHAQGQVASFRLTREWKNKNLIRALNANLPPDIRVLEVSPASDEFHARFDAKSKTYRYQIYTAEVMSPFLVRYAWHYPYPLDSERMREDSQSLVGTHDFSAFTVLERAKKNFVRTINEALVEAQEALLILNFTGDGFLRYQVRTMVGALVESNRKRLKAESIAELIRSRSRKLVGAPAPAKGLTLMKVEY